MVGSVDGDGVRIAPNAAQPGLVYVIKQLELALRPRFMKICAEAGLSAAQYTALTVLRLRPGITSSELARRSLVRAQTMAATMDPLIEAGLVRREPNPNHGRHILLHLTDAGSAKIDAVEPAVRELEEQLVAELDPTEAAQFADFLRRSRHAMGAAERQSLR